MTGRRMLFSACLIATRSTVAARPPAHCGIALALDGGTRCIQCAHTMGCSRPKWRTTLSNDTQGPATWYSILSAAAARCHFKRESKVGARSVMILIRWHMSCHEQRRILRLGVRSIYFLRQIETSYRRPNQVEPDVPEDIRMLYHPSTLRQICYLREYLLRKELVNWRRRGAYDRWRLGWHNAWLISP